MARGAVLGLLVAGTVATAGDPQPSRPFARGFDLDRGTDWAVTAAGIPLNLAGTVWGPGQLDRNLWIAALALPARFHRGPGADAWAVAGAERMDFPERLDRPRLAGEWGPNGNDRYARLLWADTRNDFTCAVEGTRTGRPWSDLEGSAKVNLALRLARPGGWSFTALATREQGDGGAPDPLRPLPPGGPDLHAGDGLRTRRLLLGARRHWQRAHLQIYAGASSLDTWTTWTYFQRDPVRGDQLEQVDRRTFAGLEGGRTWRAGRWDHRLGWQARADRVAAAEVHASQGRARLRPLLQARPDYLAGALEGRSALDLGPRWRAEAGLRLDGRRQPGVGLALGSPSLGLSFRPGPATRLRLEHRLGLRPGDAVRGGRAMTRTAGTDLAVTTRVGEPWTAGLTLWSLDLEAETVLDPGWNACLDGGRSRRRGLEWVNRIQHGPWRAEVSLAWTRARFRDLPAGRDRVPGAVPRTAVLALGWQGARHAAQASLRWWDGYPLTADGALRAPAQTALDLRVERTWRDLTLALALHNAFGWRTANQEFAYVSRLPGEPSGGVLARHRKAADPPQLRIEAARRF